MNPFNRNDSFHIQSGSSAMVIGAPHHGTRPNVKADLGTGPIALALAQKLDARAVIVSDLRSTVDVNKNPLSLNRLVRRYALRYQNELFHELPSFIIELHGHVTGRYGVEITTGFDLNPDFPTDAHYLAQLTTLKEIMPGLITKYTGKSPTVGVYPLDRDVVKTATNTFTFQKARRARRLAGLPWTGLHIELSADLRTGKEATTAVFIESLATAIATAIQTAFQPDDMPTYTRPHRPRLLAPRTFQVKLAPQKLVNESIIIVHPDELDALDALDGDRVLIQHGEEEIFTTLSSSRTVAVGSAALPVRLRRQISLKKNGRVTISRFTFHSTFASTAINGGTVVIRDILKGCGTHVWLNPVDMFQLGLTKAMPVRVQGQPHLAAVNSLTTKINSKCPPHTAVLCQKTADKLSITIGDVLTIRPN